MFGAASTLNPTMAGIVGELLGNIKPEGQIKSSVKDLDGSIQRIIQAFMPSPLGGLPMGMFGGGMGAMAGIGPLMGLLGMLGAQPQQGQPTATQPMLSTMPIR